VARDADLLSQIPCTVALTITTDDDQLAAIIEPKAPSPSKRLKAIETLTAHGIPVIVRVDPIIPTLNNNPATLIRTLAALGVKHITSSTYKVKADNWMRLTSSTRNSRKTLSSLL
jgi:DNA repair photolyase